MQICERISMFMLLQYGAQTSHSRTAHRSKRYATAHSECRILFTPILSLSKLSFICSVPPSHVELSLPLVLPTHRRNQRTSNALNTHTHMKRDKNTVAKISKRKKNFESNPFSLPLTHTHIAVSRSARAASWWSGGNGTIFARDLRFTILRCDVRVCVYVVVTIFSYPKK